MAAKRILMLCGDFGEDYETMVPFQALLAVGGEVLIDSERRRKRRDRDHIHGRQLLFDVIVRGFHGPLQLVGLHRAEIEEQHDEPAPAHIDLDGWLHGRGVGRARGRTLRQDRLRRMGDDR